MSTDGEEIEMCDVCGAPATERDGRYNTCAKLSCRLIVGEMIDAMEDKESDEQR